MRRLRFKVLGLLVLAAIGVWVYENAPVSKLRREFMPWMECLGRWRDGCEALRAALRSRTPVAGEPAEIAPLREWAWNGLDRVAYVDYEVEKPTQTFSAAGEKVDGKVRFTVGGFRADGTRVERSTGTLVQTPRSTSSRRTIKRRKRFSRLHALPADGRGKK